MSVIGQMKDLTSNGDPLIVNEVIKLANTPVLSSLI